MFVNVLAPIADVSGIPRPLVQGSFQEVERLFSSSCTRSLDADEDKNLFRVRQASSQLLALFANYNHGPRQNLFSFPKKILYLYFLKIYLFVVESHEKLSAQRTVVYESCTQEKRSQKLKDEIVQFYIASDHVYEFLDEFALSSCLRRGTVNK